jgi:hypothetical protein
LGFSLKKLVRGAENLIGTAADAVVPGNQSNWHAPQPAQTPSPQSRGANVANSVLSHLVNPAQPLMDITKLAVDHAPQIANTIANTKLPTSTPVTVGQVAQQLPSAFQKVEHAIPGATTVTNMVNEGLVQPAFNMGKDLGTLGYAVATNTAPQYDVSLPKFAGNTALTALNVATADTGGALVDGGKAIGERVVGTSTKLLPRAARNVVATTTNLAPVTTAYGALSPIAQGDTNPMDVVKGAAEGLASAPAFGLAHGAAPVIKAGAKGYIDAIKAPVPKTAAEAHPQAGFLAGDGTEHTDVNMKIKRSGAKAVDQGQNVHVSDLIKHPELEARHPELFDKNAGLKVAYNPNPQALQSMIDHDTGQVLISRIQAPEIKSAAGRKQLVHEIQHAIDASAGKPSGTTPLFERYRNASQEARDAQERIFNSKDEIAQLKSFRNKGNLTDAEYNAHPAVRQYNSDVQTIKNTPLISRDKAREGYVNDLGELQARESGDRHAMTQPELDANPRQTNNGRATTPQARQAMSADDSLQSAEQINQRLKAMSDSPEFQEFYKGGKISGKSWNEYQRLSREYRRLVDSSPPKKAGDITPEEFAKQGLGMSDADIAKTREASNAHAMDSRLAKQIDRRAKALQENSDKELKQAINNQREAPTPIELPKVQPGEHKQAILNAKFAGDAIKDRAHGVVQLGKKLSKNDLALLDDLRTTSPEELAKQAENPQRFLAAAHAAKDFNDYTHALGSGSGQAIGYRKNYGAASLYDLSDQHTHDTLMQLGAVEKDRPGYAKERLVPDYKTGEKLGLKRLNKNFLEDISHDAGRRANDIAELQLVHGLEQAYPGQVSMGQTPRGYDKLNISSGKYISMPNKIADELNKRAFPRKTGRVLGAYDSVNAGLKYTGLGGGTFHSFATAGSVGGQQLTSLSIIKHPIQNLKLIGGTLSRSQHARNMHLFATTPHADGLSTLDRARLAGATLRANEILGDANVSAIDRAKDSRLNPIKNVHDMVFDRQIPEAKLMIFEQQTRKLDTNNPADLEKMRQVASAVNNLGGINRAVEGLRPDTAKQLSRILLATDYTETKFRKLGQALTKRGQDGKIARQMVIGKALVLALPGLVTAAAAGKLQTPEDWGKEMAKQILDPQVATPFKSKSGIAKVAKLPSTEISELGRVFQPMFDHSDGSTDRLSGLKHYGTARLAAGASTIFDLMQDKDYYGNPIQKKNADGSLNVGQTIGALALSKSPIPVQQGTKSFTGKQTVAEGVINTLGARVVNDPNDPHSRSFTFKNNTINGLPDNIRGDAQKVFGLNQKDKNGNPITVVPALHTQDNATTMLENPELIEVGKKLNDKNEQLGLPGDPFYHLDSDQQHIVLNIQADKFRNPAQKKAMTDAGQDWLPQYYTDRSSFFDALNLPKSTKTQELTAPVASDHVQSLFNIADPKARSTALATDPEAQAYFNANDLYINQGRAKQWLPAMKSYPTSTPYIEAQLNAKNFKDPQVQDYLNQVAAYNVTKGGAEAQYEGTTLSQSALKGAKNLGNYGLVTNPDGTLAIAGSAQDNGGIPVSKYGSKTAKATVPKGLKAHKFNISKTLAVKKSNSSAVRSLVKNVHYSKKSAAPKLKVATVKKSAVKSRKA